MKFVRQNDPVCYIGDEIPIKMRNLAVFEVSGGLYCNSNFNSGTKPYPANKCQLRSFQNSAAIFSQTGIKTYTDNNFGTKDKHSGTAVQY